MAEKGVAIVTGAAQGMGEVFAHRLAQDNYFVIATDIQENVSKVSDSIIKNGGESSFKVLDLSSGFSEINKLLKDINKVQNPDHGNTYFIIHPVLKHIAILDCIKD